VPLKAPQALAEGGCGVEEGVDMAWFQAKADGGWKAVS